MCCLGVGAGELVQAAGLLATFRVSAAGVPTWCKGRAGGLGVWQGGASWPACMQQHNTWGSERESDHTLDKGEEVECGGEGRLMQPHGGGGVWTDAATGEWGEGGLMQPRGVGGGWPDSATWAWGWGWGGIDIHGPHALTHAHTCPHPLAVASCILHARKPWLPALY